MKCFQCGTPNEDSTVKCKKCGIRLIAGSDISWKWHLKVLGIIYLVLIAGYICIRIFVR